MKELTATASTATCISDSDDSCDDQKAEKTAAAELESFKFGKKNVNAINVVNDSAERAVKLGSDFLSSARKEDNFQNVVQVVDVSFYGLSSQQNVWAKYFIPDISFK